MRPFPPAVLSALLALSLLPSASALAVGTEECEPWCLAEGAGPVGLDPTQNPCRPTCATVAVPGLEGILGVDPGSACRPQC